MIKVLRIPDLSEPASLCDCNKRLTLLPAISGRITPDVNMQSVLNVTWRKFKSNYDNNQSGGADSDKKFFGKLGFWVADYAL